MVLFCSSSWLGLCGAEEEGRAPIFHRPSQVATALLFRCCSLGLLPRDQQSVWRPKDNEQAAQTANCARARGSKLFSRAPPASSSVHRTERVGNSLLTSASLPFEMEFAVTGGNYRLGDVGANFEAGSGPRTTLIRTSSRRLLPFGESRGLRRATEVRKDECLLNEMERATSCSPAGKARSGLREALLPSFGSRCALRRTGCPRLRRPARELNELQFAVYKHFALRGWKSETMII